MIAAPFSENINFILGEANFERRLLQARTANRGNYRSICLSNSLGDLREVTSAFHGCQPKAENVIWRES